MIRLASLFVAVFALAGCQSDVAVPESPPAAMATTGPDQVVIYVPAMVCESCTEHVAEGLAMIPWIDDKSIQPDRKAKQVRFRVKDRAAFDLGTLKTVIAKKGYKDVQLLTGPTES